MVRTIFSAIAILLVGAAALPASAAKITEKMHVGEKPPDFVGRDVHGHRIKLSTDQGKVTVITFWATWCTPCLRELPVLEAVQEMAGKQHLRVIAIGYQQSRRTVRRVKKKLGKYQLTFAYDPGGRVAREFGINAIPHMYMLNKRGKIARIRVGYGEGSIKELVDELNKLLTQD